MTKHCQHCNTDFVNQSTLTRHNNTKHADKIPAFIHHEHRCLICGTKFGRKDALRRHNLSTHTLDQKKRCQFCQANFRRDYFPRHESTCARKYWAKFCRNADLTKGVRDDQSDEISRRQPIRREMSLDAPLFLAKAGDKGLRVVHEIDIDTRLASRAFDFVFVHCGETGDLESLSEAITAGFRHSVPIKPPEYLGAHRTNYQFRELYWLATRVGEYVCGEKDLNDEDDYGNTLLDDVCTAGAASLLEPLFWRGAGFNELSLLHAIESESFDTVRFCLVLGADPDNYSSDWTNGKSLLTLASANSETSHIVPLLIEYGAIVSMRDYNEETPLHMAAQRADVDLLHVLLTEDSSPDFLGARNGEGYSVLEVAIESIHDCGVPQDVVLNFATALLDAVAEADWLDYYCSALCCAVGNECGAIVRLLLDRQPDSTRKTECLNTALEEAAFGGSENLIGVLIEAGATVYIEVLEHFLVHESLGKVESLLKARARVDHIGDVVLKCLFEAAQDQRLSGIKDAEDARPRFSDAVAKYELLCLYFLDDERLRDLHSGTGVEDFGF